MANPLGTRRWATDRSRMQRDLSSAVDRLSDEILLRPLPPNFDPITHGLSLEAALTTLGGMITDPSLFPGGVTVAATPPADASTVAASSEVLRRSFEMVQDERDRLAESVRLAETETARLRHEVQVLRVVRPPASPTPSERARIQRLDATEERVRLVEAERDDLRRDVDRLEAEAVEVIAQLDEYRQLGSPEAIRDERQRLLQAAALAVAATEVSSAACTQYEATIGANLLAFERAELTIASFFSTIFGDAPDRDREILRPLVSATRRLVAAGDPYATLKSAVDRIQASRAVASPDLNTSLLARVLSSTELPTPETVDQLATASEQASFDSSTRIALFENQPIELAYNRLMRAAHTSIFPAIPMPSPSTHSLPEDEEKEGDAEDSGEPAADRLGAPHGSDSPPRGFRPTIVGARSRSRADPVSSRPSYISKAIYEDLRSAFRKRKSAEIAALRAAVGRGAVPWPVGPPTPADANGDPVRLREMAWQFDLFPQEQLAPNKPEAKQILGNLGPEYRYATLQEVLDLYDEEPWSSIRSPPQPISFDPSSDPALKRFHDQTTELYEDHAQVPWEKTHFIVVDPNDTIIDSKTGEVVVSASDFSKQRRSRNSKYTKFWDRHLGRLRDVLPTVGADLLADPFLYWPPPYGVVLVLPKMRETLKEAIAAMDQLSPARIYFRCPDGARLHREALGIQRVDRLPALPGSTAAPEAASGRALLGGADTPMVVDGSEASDPDDSDDIPPSVLSKRRRTGAPLIAESPRSTVADASLLVGLSSSTSLPLDAQGGSDDVDMGDPSSGASALTRDEAMTASPDASASRPSGGDAISQPTTNDVVMALAADAISSRKSSVSKTASQPV